MEGLSRIYFRYNKLLKGILDPYSNSVLMGFQIEKLKSSEISTNQFIGFNKIDNMTFTILTIMISTKIVELRSIDESNEEKSKYKNTIDFLIKILSERNMFGVFFQIKEGILNFTKFSKSNLLIYNKFCAIKQMRNYLRIVIIKWI